MNPQLARNNFLLDTATGRVWQLTTFSDVDDTPSVWTFMPRVDNNLGISQLVRERGLKPKGPPFLSTANSGGKIAESDAAKFKLRHYPINNKCANAPKTIDTIR
jgi:hypothetical protein